MSTEEAFVWRGNISTYQCDLIPIKSDTLASSLDGIKLRSLLLNVWIYIIAMLTYHYLLPINPNTLASNLYVLNPILIFELMYFPYFHVHITSSSPFIYTPIIQILCDVTYYFYEHSY